MTEVDTYLLDSINTQRATLTDINNAEKLASFSGSESESESELLSLPELSE